MKIKLPSIIQDNVWDASKTCYHDNLLTGSDNWSGSSLTGKAKKYGSSYYKSRQTLLDNINTHLPDGWSADSELVRLEGENVWRKCLVINRGQTYTLNGRKCRSKHYRTFLWDSRITTGFRERV